MSEVPALVIQGVFLGANIAFLLNGEEPHTGFIVSIGILIVLYAIQTASGNGRLLYLFPVHIHQLKYTVEHEESGFRHRGEETIKRDSASVDTTVLWLLLVTSIACFGWGVTGISGWVAIPAIVGTGLLARSMWRGLRGQSVGNSPWEPAGWFGKKVSAQIETVRAAAAEEAQVAAEQKARELYESAVSDDS